MSDELDIAEVVQALFDLPEGEADERRLEQLPIIRNWLYGEVFGRKFCLQGARNADGEWEVIHEVSPR